MDQLNSSVEDNFEVTSSSSEEDDSIESEGHMQPFDPRKYRFVARKKQYVEYLKEQRVPRVMKGDIRKCYPAMLANVLNSGDFPLIYGFLDTFLSPNIRHSSVKTVTTITNETIQMDDHHVGVFGMARYWCGILNIGPDVVFHIRKPQIHTFSKSECSQIVCEFEMHGTRVYDMSHSGPQTTSRALEDYEDKKARLSATQCKLRGAQCRADAVAVADATGDAQLVAPKDIVQAALEMQRLVREYVGTLTLAREPVRFRLVGTIVLFTDESKRISQIDLDTQMDHRVVVQ